VIENDVNAAIEKWNEKENEKGNEIENGVMDENEKGMNEKGMDEKVF